MYIDIAFMNYNRYRNRHASFKFGAGLAGKMDNYFASPGYGRLMNGLNLAGAALPLAFMAPMLVPQKDPNQAQTANPNQQNKPNANNQNNITVKNGQAYNPVNYNDGINYV